MHITRSRRTGLVALAMSAGLLLAACGDDDDPIAAASAAATTTATAMADTTAAEPMADTTAAEPMAEDDMSGGADATMGAYGPGCAAVPADGAGSFAGMATDPAATAASNNPLLSTLVTAVTTAGLVDTLNGEGPFTIFAPTNDAFADIPAADLEAVLADQETLTSILTLHVIAGSQMSVADLVAAGSATTVNGAELTFTEGADGALMIDGSATAVCMDVPTANATVHIIDSVLLPPS